MTAIRTSFCKSMAADRGTMACMLVPAAFDACNNKPSPGNACQGPDRITATMMEGQP